MSEKRDSIHKLSVQDLFHIRSNAIEFMQNADSRNYPIRHSQNLDEHSLRTLAYCRSVIGYLRSKNMIDFTIEMGNE